jgi:hypothetical protein
VVPKVTFAMATFKGADKKEKMAAWAKENNDEEMGERLLQDHATNTHKFDPCRPVRALLMSPKDVLGRKDHALLVWAHRAQLFQVAPLTTKGDAWEPAAGRELRAAAIFPLGGPKMAWLVGSADGTLQAAFALPSPVRLSSHAMSPPRASPPPLICPPLLQLLSMDKLMPKGCARAEPPAGAELASLIVADEVAPADSTPLLSLCCARARLLRSSRRVFPADAQLEKAESVDSPRLSGRVVVGFTDGSVVTYDRDELRAACNGADF